MCVRYIIHTLSRLILTHLCEVGTIIISILEIGQLELSNLIHVIQLLHRVERNRWDLKTNNRNNYVRSSQLPRLTSLVCTHPQNFEIQMK